MTGFSMTRTSAGTQSVILHKYIPEQSKKDRAYQLGPCKVLAQRID